MNGKTFEVNGQSVFVRFDGQDKSLLEEVPCIIVGDTHGGQPIEAEIPEALVGQGLEVRRGLISSYIEIGEDWETIPISSSSYEERTLVVNRVLGKALLCITESNFD